MEFTRLQIYILIAVGAVVLISLLLFFGLRPEPLTRAEITFWGIENEEIYQELIREFNGQSSGIKVEYIKKNPQTYERELLNAMAAGQGPDIFVIHHTWLPQYQDKISSLSSQMMPIKTYNDTFVDVAIQDFVTDGYIWAVPFYVDSLALYWNKDIFNSVGIPQPPKTWDEFLENVQRLTIKDEGGNIVRSGAALGTATNINNAADIVSLLMMQSGAKMINNEKTAAAFAETVVSNQETYKPGADALRFYTDFANSQKTVYAWNNRMMTSLESFLQGKTAMMIDYSTARDEIKKKSPYLNFSIASMPQIKKSQLATNYANYWAQTVWSASKNKQAAWQFILWMAEKENQKKYIQKAKKPVSRRDLINWQKDDAELGVFATQSLSARSWYQIDHSAITDIFNEMIGAVVGNQMTPLDAVERAAVQVTNLMREYRGSSGNIF